MIMPKSRLCILKNEHKSVKISREIFTDKVFYIHLQKNH